MIIFLESHKGISVNNEMALKTYPIMKGEKPKLLVITLDKNMERVHVPVGSATEIKAKHFHYSLP